MEDKYEKNKGYADAEGVKFQLDLVILSSLNALLHHKQWRISSENKKAGKFDDVVVEFSDGSSILIQAKHKKNEKENITKQQFLSTKKNSDFSLPKYFFSNEEIKGGLGKETFIICTNANIDEEGLGCSLTRHSVHSDDVLHCESLNGFFFTFNERFLPELKDSVAIYYEKYLQEETTDKSIISDINVMSFLEKLRIFSSYPSMGDLQDLIEKSASLSMNASSWGKITYHEIYRKVENWLKQSRGEYMTQSRIKAIFCEIKSDKYCQLLKGYDVSFEWNESNIIYLDGPKKIFHVVIEGSYFMQMLKIYHTLQGHKAKTLFMTPDDDVDVQNQMVEAFGHSQYTFLVMVVIKITDEDAVKEVSVTLREILKRNQWKKVILVVDNNNDFVQRFGVNDILQIDGSVSFQDLSEDYQERLLKKKNVLFQGMNICLEKLLESQVEVHTKALHSEILEKFVKDEEVKVGEPLLGLDEETDRYYVRRKFQRETDESGDNPIPEENLYEVTKKMVLISDSAGMGKSTVLTKIATHIKEHNCHLWVIRINLNDYTKILSAWLIRNRKTISVRKLLNSKETTKLTNQFENFIFSMNEKVVLMLDGVDEISPDYTGLILGMLYRCQKVSNYVKIFVTTRPHVTHELGAVLEADSYKMLPFTRSDQVDFLGSYWAHNLRLDDADEKKCKRYAETLIDKMSTWIESYDYWKNTFAAIPLQVKMLAEIFQENNPWDKSTHWEGCREYLEGDGTKPKLPEKFNIATLYDTFVEKKRDVFMNKGNPNGSAMANPALLNHFERCLVYHYSLALRVILENSESVLFTNCHTSDEDMEEYALKIGIIQRSANESQFIHRTFAEYFQAESIVRELKLQNPDVKFQCFILDKVLVGDRFQIVCSFLENLLQKVSLPPNVFKQYQSFRCKTNPNLIFQLARKGYVAILRVILENINFKIITGKKVNIKNWSAKLTFKKRNTLNYLKALAQIAGINISNRQGATPLHFAVIGGHLAMVKFLVKQGADPDIRDCDGKTALHLAEERNRPYIIEFLVNQGASVNVTDRYGCTVLHLAIDSYRAAPVKYLVKHGGDVNARDFEGRTPLHLAVQYNRPNVVKYLVEHSADVNVRDDEGRTALYFAVNRDCLNVVDYLARHGADVNIADRDGRTVLYLAIERYRLDVLECIMTHGADVNVRDSVGRSALYLAFKLGLEKAVTCLVQNGADVNIKNNRGRSILHYVTELGRLKSVRYLVEQGADLNVRDKDDCTPLHLAVKNGLLRIVRYFVEHGADVTVKDSKGRVALDHAIRRGSSEMIECLKQVGVGDDTVNNNYPRFFYFFKK